MPSETRCWWTICCASAAITGSTLITERKLEDAAYEPYQLRMDALMQAAGYQRGTGLDHAEVRWRRAFRARVAGARWMCR